MEKTKKFGYFKKSKLSNKKLVLLFEENQKLRYGFTNKDWSNKKIVIKLAKSEKKTRKLILGMLKSDQIKTADDFYRASFFFHHGNTSNSYSLAVTLAAISMIYGDTWGKNLFAVALDRFMLTNNQSQIFGTQYKKIKNKWMLAPFNKKVSDKVRKRYFVDSILKAKQTAKILNSEENF